MDPISQTFNRMIREAETICILGHMNPDGDCVGSTLGTCNYIRNLCRAEGLEKIVCVYLEQPSAKFSYLSGYSEIRTDPNNAIDYALSIILDCADEKRMGRFGKLYKSAAHSFLADHHFTNPGFGEAFRVLPQSSSASEVVYDLMEPEYIDRDVSECIYTGLVHDTGVFRYPSTSAHTMAIAGRCMETGINFNSIIDDSFFAMRIEQKKVLGEALLGIRSYLSGRFVASYVTQEMMTKYGVSGTDLDGVISEIRTTTGAIGAAFLYETQTGQFKLSLRSNSDALDVSAIAQGFGGGGHKRAAGGFLTERPEEGLRRIVAEVAKQIGDSEGGETD